jgi:hypothetical protein
MRPGGITTEELVRDAIDAPTLSAILDDVEWFLGRFVEFTSDTQPVALALWVAHVYAIDAAPAAAYLRITSAVEESGKTTLLEVLETLLGDRCLNLLSATPAFVFRMRDKVGPLALLLDEIDNTLNNRKDDGARDLLALVNGGYRRSAKVGRTVGREHEGRQFKAFGPAAIAGLGSLHPTTESRCIPIQLDRKVRGSGERWLPFLVEDDSRRIASALADWATPETVAALKVATPVIPPELRDRQAEAWWPLLVIADAAGGYWPEQARVAAVSLHADIDAERTMGTSTMLLGHIARIAAERDVDRFASAQLIRWLVELAEGPWARWYAADVDRATRGDDHALDKSSASLAAILRPFRRPDGKPLRPHVIRLADDRTARGYLLEDFADAFDRYLTVPPVTGVTPVTALASTVTPVTPVTGPQDKEDR